MTSSNTYHVKSWVGIDSGVTLTIEPGTWVKFDPSYSLIVNGALVASGTQSLPVHFTSSYDDGDSVDLNGDGGATPPSTDNDWQVIKIESGGSAVFNHAKIRYGGDTYGCCALSTTLYNNGGSLSLVNSEVATGTTNGIVNKYGTTTVSFSTIRNHNVGIEIPYDGSGSVSIATSTIKDNAWNGIWAQGSGVLELKGGNTFINNPYATQIEFASDKALEFKTFGNNTSTGTGINGIYVTGTLGANQAWGKDKIAYVTSGLIIPSGKTLTLAAGSVMKFMNSSGYLAVDGTLVAYGNAEDSGGAVYFTSIKDDIVIGDTNGNGATTPERGDWVGVTVGQTGSTTLDLAIIKYGGNGDGCCSTASMVYNNDGILNILNSAVASSSYFGIKTASGTTTISNSDIAFNPYGYYHAGGSVTLQNNKIHDNSWNGIYNETSALIFASNHYWGDDTGPYHYLSNTTGLGNSVSDYVNYDFWQTNLRYLRNDWAVNDSNPNYCYLHYAASTTYSGPLASAVSKWNGLSRVYVIATTTNKNLDIVDDIPRDDVIWKGQYRPSLNRIELNPYYLDSNSFSERQNTIQHELGHALGLDHSYLGNIMNRFQTDLTEMGNQDGSDYHYQWGTNNTCYIHA